MFVDVLGWLLLYLCANPDIQKKLQAELDTVLTDGRDPTVHDKDDLNYTRKSQTSAFLMSSKLLLLAIKCFYPYSFSAKMELFLL